MFHSQAAIPWYHLWCARGCCAGSFCDQKASQWKSCWSGCSSCIGCHGVLDLFVLHGPLQRAWTSNGCPWTCLAGTRWPGSTAAWYRWQHAYTHDLGLRSPQTAGPSFPPRVLSGHGHSAWQVAEDQGPKTLATKDQGSKTSGHRIRITSPAWVLQAATAQHKVWGNSAKSCQCDHRSKDWNQAPKFVEVSCVASAVKTALRQRESLRNSATSPASVTYSQSLYHLPTSMLKQYHTSHCTLRKPIMQDKISSFLLVIPHHQCGNACCQWRIIFCYLPAIFLPVGKTSKNMLD